MALTETTAIIDSRAMRLNRVLMAVRRRTPIMLPVDQADGFPSPAAEGSAAPFPVRLSATSVSSFPLRTSSSESTMTRASREKPSPPLVAGKPRTGRRTVPNTHAGTARFGDHRAKFLRKT